MSVIEPGVGEIIWQMPFALLDVVDEPAEVGAAPTTVGYGAGSGKGNLLAAVALECYVRRMPFVDLAERDFASLVVRFDSLDDLRHWLTPSYPSAAPPTPTIATEARARVKCRKNIC